MEYILIDLDNTYRVIDISEEAFYTEVKDYLFYDWYYDFPKAIYNCFEMIIPEINSNIFKVNQLATLFYNRNQLVYGPVIVGYHGIHPKHGYIDFLGLDKSQIDDISIILDDLIENLRFLNPYVS